MCEGNFVLIEAEGVGKGEGHEVLLVLVPVPGARTVDVGTYTQHVVLEVRDVFAVSMPLQA